MPWDICPPADCITQAYGCTDFPGEWAVDASVCDSLRFHAGVDLGSVHGGWSIYQAPVYATRPGIVVGVGLPYLGPFAVTVQYGDVYVEHGHLDSAAVTFGDEVVAGTLIGRLGTQGNSTAPHLHIEARTDGPHQGNPDTATIDPTPYLHPPGGFLMALSDDEQIEIRDKVRQMWQDGCNGPNGDYNVGATVDATAVLVHEARDKTGQLWDDLVLNPQGGDYNLGDLVVQIHAKLDALKPGTTDLSPVLAAIADLKAHPIITSDPDLLALVQRIDGHFSGK